MPMKAAPNQFVADPEHYLTEAAIQEVNRKIYNLRVATSCEMAVAVVASTGDESIEEYSERIFTGWKLGKADNDNGLLLLIAVDDRMSRIQTGYGLEGILPDITCKEIIDKYLAPNMRENNVDAAVTQTVGALCDIVENPSNRDEVLSKRGEAGAPLEAPVDSDVIMHLVFLLVCAGFVATSINFFTVMHKVRKGRDNYDKAMIWKRDIKVLWLLTLLSCGSAIIFPLLGMWLSRRYRNKRIICDVCGAKMRKLSETDDNAYLDSGQDLEERLNTIDYDVWLCDKCGAVKRYAYKQDQTRYKECPNCHVVAMYEKCRSTLVPPTVRREGVGESVCECLHCHHQERRRFGIPRKEDPTAAAALAAGAILGSGGRGGGGGGGFTGFGGGSTGGGGASGGW